MALRSIRPEERALILHLLSFIKEGKRYVIPEQVAALGEAGIQLSSRGDHAADLVEADYRDGDGRSVLITLTTNEFDELYELDLWKVDFSPLQQYPAPAQVRQLS